MSRMKRAWSAFMAVVLTVFLLPLTSFGTVSAEGETERYYTIRGYNSYGIVKDPDGNTADSGNRIFCMDYKQDTPSGNQYIRVKLSELETYHKKNPYDKVFTDSVKRRLLTLRLDWSDILRFIDSDTTYRENLAKEEKWLETNCPDTYTHSSFNSSINNYRDQQSWVWTLVHDDSEWERFVEDDGTNTGHCELYRWRESSGWSNTYPYESVHPITDEHSMWNVVIKPVIDYIDSLIADHDYTTMGYDAWVYLAVNEKGETAQNMFGGAFQTVSEASVSVQKYDGSGKAVAGAVLQILDENGTPVQEFVPTEEAYTVSGLDVDTVYTLHEEVPPAGYLAAEDTTFIIDAQGKIDILNTTSEIERRNGEDILIIRDEQTSVSISKTDIADSSEVAGAKIQVLDSDGNIADEWTSTTEAHVITGLTADEEYTLHEEVAPDGYTVATDTTFVISKEGVVTTTGTVREDGVILVEDSKTVVRVSKVDIADGEEVEGATIQILDNQDDVVEEWTSTTDAHIIEGLKTGVEYTLKETVAPEGYTITSDTTFTIDETGKVTSTGTVSQDEAGAVLLVEDAKTVVRVSKVDIADGEELEGATIQIIETTDNGENVVEEWTSTTDAHIIEGLKTGTEYTLRETVAPDGYTVTSDTKFTIDETGAVTSTGTTTTDNDDLPVLLVEDSKTVVKVSKVDATSNKEIEGATIQILDDKGNVVEEWVSTTDEHSIEGLKTGVEYTLRETVAPTGYAVTTDTKFTIAADGTVTATGTTISDEGVILIADGQNEVTINKTDINGEELDGAVIQILDGSGNAVDSWTSKKGETHTVTGLVANVEYTLHEETAPAGYTVAADTKFSFDADGSVKVGNTTVSDNLLLVEDTLTEVKISKTDITDGKELEGAKIQLFDGTKKIEEWVSTKDAYVIRGLETGKEYTLRETVAPEGYTIAADTTFTIDTTGKVTSTGTVTTDGVIIVEDSKTSVKVSKVDITTYQELEGAHIQILEGDNIVEQWDSTKKPHMITGLKTGVEYTLRETVAPEGYTVATDTTFTIDAKGKITTTGTVSENGVILIKDEKTSVEIGKIDGDTGKGLSGAYMVIVDAADNTVQSWTSDGDTFKVTGLKAGKYTIRELTAPNGYTVAEDISFTISEQGKLSTDAEMKDGVIVVKDYYVDIETTETDHNAYKPVIPSVSFTPVKPVATVGTDGPAPAPNLVTIILPDGTRKDPVTGKKAEDVPETSETPDAPASEGTTDTSDTPADSTNTPDTLSKETEDGIVREDVANDKSIEEVDSGAPLAEDGEMCRETGIFAIAAVMAAALAVGLLTRKRAK